MNAKVYFPQAGEFFLLNWWCPNYQSQFVLAKSEQALLHTVKVILREHCRVYYAQLKFLSCTRIKMVVPPDAWLTNLEKAHKARIIQSWISCVTHYISTFGEKPLPQMFTSKKSEEGDWYEVSLNEDPAVLYDKYHAAWMKAFHGTSPVDDASVPSKADLVTSEVWWSITSDFGHHCNGLLINKHDLDDLEFPDVPLFYFSKVKDRSDLLKSCRDMLEVKMAKLKEAEEENRAAKRESFELAEKLTYQKVMEIFKV